ncbi:MAG TPA: hypothetical protein VF765_06765 [Polyangiaceae bacterium]
MSRLLLDAGALIALDRNDQSMWTRLVRARQDGIPLLTHVGIVGQAWRSPRQARLAQALRAIKIAPLDASLGRSIGELLGATGSDDVVDASLVLISRAGDRIYTSDPDDLLALAAAAERDVEIIRV